MSDTTMTKSDYKKYVDEKSPNSNVLVNTTWAFVIGGLICVLGQLISNYFASRGLTIEQIASATAITLIFLSAFTTGLGWYDKLAKKAGAGTIVPITGFSNAIVAPAIEHKSEGFVLGIGAKMFIIAGPVLVYGTVASVIVGLIYYFMK